jgi:hypothetical protein
VYDSKKKYKESTQTPKYGNMGATKKLKEFQKTKINPDVWSVNVDQVEWQFPVARSTVKRKKRMRHCTEKKKAWQQGSRMKSSDWQTPRSFNKCL